MTPCDSLAVSAHRPKDRSLQWERELRLEPAVSGMSPHPDASERQAHLNLNSRRHTWTQAQVKMTLSRSRSHPVFGRSGRGLVANACLPSTSRDRHPYAALMHARLGFDCQKDWAACEKGHTDEKGCVNERRIREIDFRPFVMKEIDMRDSLCLRVLRPCVYMCLRRVFVCVFGRQMPEKGDMCKIVYRAIIWADTNDGERGDGNVTLPWGR